MSALVVEKIGPGATVQDFGRPGHMHEGVPPGGALVPELLAAANRSLGNASGDAAIELPLFGARFRAEGNVVVSLDGQVHSLADGETFEVPPTDEAARYVALAGGVDVPELLGGRGTLLVAQFGGYEGRPLRKGDVLKAAGAANPREVSIPPRGDFVFRVVPGPDEFPEAALQVLQSTTWRISALGNRVGTRLENGRIPRPATDRPISTPMVRGAIQVTTDGTPIVLGPDHPTTGGYPVIAVVAREELGRLARRRPGESIRFVAERRL